MKIQLVQIAPGAHPTWGGQPMRVTRVNENGWVLKGYVLVPHRGACREAWIEVPAAATRLIGELSWGEGDWLSRAASYNGLLMPSRP